MSVVLVVEDEFFIRLAAVDALTEAGYVVYDAEDAAAAQAILQQRDDINVLFTDVMMPGEVDGFGLATWALKHRADLSVILTSGNTKLEQFPMNDDPRVTFLHKPYQYDELVEALRRVAPPVEKNADSA